MNTIFFKTILGAIILSGLFFIVELINGSTPDMVVSLYGLLSSLFISGVLVYYIINSTLRGFKLALTIFFIYFLIGFFNILIEAYIFNVTDRIITIRELLNGFIVTLVYSPILVFLFDKWDGETEKIQFVKRKTLSWIWRVVVSDISYLFFYLLAGFILYAVYPPLMDFYGDKVPPFDIMINTQFFRAIIFIAVALIIVKTFKGTTLRKAIFIGVLFAVIGGIAPLIPPNENMPGYIRLGHGFEVAFSNFFYGMFISYLLAQKVKTDIVEEEFTTAFR